MRKTVAARSTWRRFAAQLAIFVLLFQAGTAALHLSAIAANKADHAFAGAVPPGALLICTPSGVKIIDANGNEIPASQTDKPLVCPLCQLLAAVSLHAPPAIFTPVIFAEVPEWLREARVAIRPSALIDRPRSRSPPVLSV
ncbi:MAG TPA: hypothetical protein VH858_12925 [Hyphomicrobiales bacterium]